ncbi:MAG: hypothetical protein QM831_17745 [Kofleriaceae bacterium]
MRIPRRPPISRNRERAVPIRTRKEIQTMRYAILLTLSLFAACKNPSNLDANVKIEKAECHDKVSIKPIAPAVVANPVAQK